jgi:hypothetical protein
MITEIRGEIDRVLDKWRRDHRAANDARIEGGTALFAVSQDSPEGDIQAANQRAAWANQVKLLEQKEHRTFSDGLLLAQLRRNIRRVDEAEALRHPTPENMAGRRLADFGPVGAANGLLGAFGGVRLWMVLAGGMALTTGAAAIQTARLDHAKHDLADARHVAQANAAAAHQWQERSEHYRQGLIDAAEVAHQASAALTAERAAEAHARARERIRNREIANVLAHAAEPPAWRLRDDGTAESQPPATTP